MCRQDILIPSLVFKLKEYQFFVVDFSAQTNALENDCHFESHLVFDIPGIHQPLIIRRDLLSRGKAMQ
jgi:hypothetical protein